MEVDIIADSEAEARQRALDAGLKMVMVISSAVIEDAETDRVSE